jgi:TetR/AcrR family transcriptional regulator, cholesterol catabolism regulator
MKAETTTKKVVAQVANEAIVEKKHKQIVRAAGEIFSQKGYHGAGMRDIADASGINLSYLYKYVSSKNDILFLFYDHLHKKWDHVFQSLDDESVDPVSQLREFLLAMLKVIHGLKYEIITVYTESRHLERESLRTVMAGESRKIKLLEKHIRQGVRLGCYKTKDAAMAANFIEFLLVVEAMRGWNFHKKVSFNRFSQLFVQFVLAALGAEDKEN